ncbi:hypothetical protein K8S19_09940 [bacterium]|nr:hypothetical protein [bacterium]
MKSILRTLTLLLFFVPAVPQTGFADIIHAEPILVSTSDQWFAASSQFNVAMKITITADASGDTLQMIGIRNDWYSPYASNTTDIVTNSVRLWYVAVDSGSFSTSTAQFVKILTDDSMDPWVWYDMALNLFVQNGSAIYITVDITATPTANAIIAFHIFEQSMAFESNASPAEWQPPNTPAPDFYPDYPESDPTAFMRITPYLPATGLEVSDTPKSFSQLSSGQTFYPIDFTLHNTGTPFTGPVFVSGVTITVKDSLGATLAPATALESIGLRNKTTQVVLAAVTGIPSAPAGIFIPLSVSVTAMADLELELFATVSTNTATVVSEFSLALNTNSQLDAIDAYTRKPVSITSASGDAFPMQTGLFQIFFSATNLNTYHTPMLVTDTVVLKGQTNVNPINLTFINPGNTRTSRVDITHLSLAVTDGDGDPLTPSDVFSRVAISGGILYGETTSIPNTGSLVTITLSNSYASVPVYQPLTVTVLADILPDAMAVEFRLSLAGSAGVIAQDANTIFPVPVSAAFASDPFPMFSNTVRIASSFQVSSRSQSPTTLYPNQRASMLALTFSHPGPTDVGSLVVQGITLTAQDRTGTAVAFSQNCTALYARNSLGATLTEVTAMPGGSHLFIALPDITIAPFENVIISLGIGLADKPQSQTLRIGITDNTAFTVTQPSDLTRPVFVAGLWPMQSNTATLGGGEGRLRLSNYPNPFAAGRTVTRIAYYLNDTSSVTAHIYTLTGDQVQTLAKGDYQSAGEQILIWNGRTATGSAVKNGVYLLRIESVPVTQGEPIIQIRKIAVVK